MGSKSLPTDNEYWYHPLAIGAEYIPPLCMDSRHNRISPSKQKQTYLLPLIRKVHNTKSPKCHLDFAKSYWTYIEHILNIYWTYIGHILNIYWTYYIYKYLYLEHISIITCLTRTLSLQTSQQLILHRRCRRRGLRRGARELQGLDVDLRGRRAQGIFDLCRRLGHGPWDASGASKCWVCHWTTSYEGIDIDIDRYIYIYMIIYV